MTHGRSREQMCEQILRECNTPGGLATGEIVKRLNLGWKAFKDLSGKMLEKQLVMEREGRMQTTVTGLNYVNFYASLSRILPLDSHSIEHK